VHPAVEDTLVFGVPDDRFGQRIVGIAALAAGATDDPAAILADTKTRLSSYKIPKELLVVPTVPRAPNGKPDYATAKKIFESRRG
jgi:acyl-CoA synthetase (AMP-forming)/AMP-acid ligase II